MNQGEKTLLKVEGMDCANCAQTITRTLEKSGLENVQVNFITGEVVFEEVKPDRLSKVKRDINGLGYTVVESPESPGREDKIAQAGPADSESHYKKTARKFYFSLFFTIPLLLHMVLSHSWLHHPQVQFLLCVPVMLVGWWHFGRSAWKSIQAGAANMDVLITLGSSAAFFYSIIGSFFLTTEKQIEDFLFFETAATIITLVLLGNLIEQRSVRQTTSAIQELSKLQATKAKKIFRNQGEEIIQEVLVEELKIGDEVQVNTGDKIPVDGKIISGQALINEAIITGESIPVLKSKEEAVIGSTLVESGSIRIMTEQIGSTTTLSRIISLVKNAQMSKPPIQELGDKISTIFVPAVVGISVLTFLIAHFFVNKSMQDALMSSIAVLVISCPCAMGLAAPTAIMVGLGRAAQNGILIKGGRTLELLSSLKTIVFDKTGTLTTGNFIIRELNILKGSEAEIKTVLFALEKNSSHPIAKSLVRELKSYEVAANKFVWKKIEEDKGLGINATLENGDLFSLGSFQMVRHFYQDLNHSLYLLRNNELIATIDLEDEIKSGTKEVIESLKKLGMRVIMVSGDRDVICQSVAKKVGIEEVHSEKMPDQKLTLIAEFSARQPTAMIGDGINDAPALAQANLGISMSDASAIAIQSAQVVLLHRQDLSVLIKALRIGKKTYSTIKQNFFWAFLYNVIAIPFAAAGYLSPMIGALSMAFSDLIVVGNSVRLKFTRI